MLSKIGQELSRKVIGSSLAGDGLLVRIRSTSIALLGLVAAIGLALVAFVANQGWPGLINSPIPNSVRAVTAVHDAVRVGGSSSSPVAVSGHVPASVTRAGALTRAGSGAHSTPPHGAKLHGARAVRGGSPSPAPGPAPAPSPPAAPEQLAPPPTGQGTEGVPVSTKAPGQPSAKPVSSSVNGSDSARSAGKEKAGVGEKAPESHQTEGVGHSHSSGNGKGHQVAKAPRGHRTVPPPATSTSNNSAETVEEVPDKGSGQETFGKDHGHGKSGKG